MEYNIEGVTWYGGENERDSDYCGKGCYWRIEGDTLEFCGRGNLEWVHLRHHATAEMPDPDELSEAAKAGSSFPTFNLDAIMDLLDIPCVLARKINVPSAADAVEENPAECREMSYRRVVVGTGIKAIESFAFKGLPIEEAELADSVTDIGFWAFSDCDSLEAINIPRGVEDISYGAFADCGKLRITVDESNENYADIDGVLFDKDKSVLIKFGGSGADYIIPDGVSEIEDNAFAGCKRLRSVVIPEGVTRIGNGAFSGCERLVSISIPEGVSKIGDSAFKNCKRLETIALPQSVTEIGRKAFKGCSFLTSVVIPEYVIEIKKGTFENCGSLTEVSMAFGLSEIGSSAFKNCCRLKTIALPQSVTDIDKHAFEGCEKLKNVVIPENVLKIGKKAFSYCNELCTISIPRNILRIGKRAFEDCWSLKTVIFGGTEEDWEEMDIADGNERLRDAEVKFEKVD